MLSHPCERYNVAGRFNTINSFAVFPMPLYIFTITIITNLFGNLCSERSFKCSNHDEGVMNMDLLRKIWEDIRNRARCDSCPLKDEKIEPLIFEPDREVKVMVITYGPNRIESKGVIASLANHPTYTYLSALFGGNFRPEENATAYWTHLRKCFIKDEKGNLLIPNSSGKPLNKKEEIKLEGDIDKKAREICTKVYLKEEIEAVQPELILAVGREAVNFLKSISEDDRLSKTDLSGIFLDQKGMLNNVKLNMGLTVNVAVVPHPSGKSRFFVNPSPEEKEKIAKILENIKENILKVIQ